MVIELSEEAAARVTAAAAARGLTETELVEELVTEALPSGIGSAGDLLQAFIGCGASGDRRDRSIHELRDELSAAQLDRTSQTFSRQAEMLPQRQPA